VVAEKLEPIVKLGTVTTRFKDFFDLYILSNEKAFDAPMLVRQVTATFAHRGTAATGDLPVALTDDFARNPESQRQWEAFLRRNDVVGAPELFSDAVGRVRDFVFPILQTAAQEGGSLEESWSPQGGWIHLEG
jgi:hypothetical protein